VTDAPAPLKNDRALGHCPLSEMKTTLQCSDLHWRLIVHSFAIRIWQVQELSQNRTPMTWDLYDRTTTLGAGPERRIKMRWGLCWAIHAFLWTGSRQKTSLREAVHVTIERLNVRLVRSSSSFILRHLTDGRPTPYLIRDTRTDSKWDPCGSNWARAEQDTWDL